MPALSSPYVELKDETPTSNKPTVLDKYGLIKFSFIFFGLISVIPFFALGTPKPYWMYKFRDVQNNQSHEIDYHHKTRLQTYFFSYLDITGFVSGLLTMGICILCSHKISEYIRNIGSLIGALICFILITVMIYVNLDHDQLTFLWFTLATVAVLNFFSTVFQSTAVSVAAKLPPEYVNYMISAQTLAGILIVLLQIIIVFIELPILTSAFFFFLIADIGVFFAIGLYIWVTTTSFFKHYDNRNKTVVKTPSLTVLPQCIKLYWVQALTALLSLLQATAIIPVIMQVESSSESGSRMWKEKLFTQCFGLLNFYVTDFTGRKLAGYCPVNRPRLLLVITVLRFVYFPAFFFCNVTPRANWPVFLDNDYGYFALVTSFGLSGGYLYAMQLFVPQQAPEPLREATTFMIITFNIVGTTTGAVLSWVIFKLLTTSFQIFNV